MFDIEGVNGKVEIKDGETYWMGSRVQKCPMCGIAPTNVDDCGEFGNPECPYFGIGLEEYEKRYGKVSDESGWYDARMRPDGIVDVWVEVKPSGYHGRLIDCYYSNGKWFDRDGELDDIFQGTVTKWMKSPKKPQPDEILENNIDNWH